MSTYIEFLLDSSQLYLIEGLECSILVDIVDIADIENVKLNNHNAFLVPKVLLNNDMINFEIYKLDMTNVLLESVSFDDILKSIGSLFLDNEHFAREQKRIAEYPYDYTIIVDSTCKHVLCGEHSILLRTLFKVPYVTCLRLKSACPLDEILRRTKEAKNKKQPREQTVRKFVKYMQQYSPDRIAHKFIADNSNRVIHLVFDKKIEKELSESFTVAFYVPGETRTDLIRNFISDSPYRRLTFVGSECIYRNGSGKLIFTYPDELPRRSCNTFDVINDDMALLTSSQRVSANRAYQTLRHTFIYIHTGKSDSKARVNLAKKLDGKLKKYLDINIDNVMSIKRKLCVFSKMKQEEVIDMDKLYKKLHKKFAQLETLESYYPPGNDKQIGTYGYQLSKQRDYSIIDAKLKEKIKNARSKIKK